MGESASMISDPVYDIIGFNAEVVQAINCGLVLSEEIFDSIEESLSRNCLKCYTFFFSSLNVYYMVQDEKYTIFSH